MKRYKDFEDIYAKTKKITKFFANKYRLNSDDLNQEISIRVFRAIDRFDGKHSLNTWIGSITKNYIIDQLRKRKVEFVALDQPFKNKHGESFRFDLQDQTKTIENGERKEFVDMLICIKKLNETERVLLKMKYVDGYSCKAIALKTKMNINTIKSHLFLARKKIVEFTQKNKIQY